MDTLQVSVQIPKCWKNLIDEHFPEDLSGIRSGGENGLSDPNPYYDDYREVIGKFSDGSHVYISLSSGQGNYYGWLSFNKSNGEEFYSAELESYDDLDTEANGVMYKIKVQWT